MSNLPADARALWHWLQDYADASARLTVEGRPHPLAVIDAPPPPAWPGDCLAVMHRALMEIAAPDLDEALGRWAVATLRAYPWGDRRWQADALRRQAAAKVVAVANNSSEKQCSEGAIQRAGRLLTVLLDGLPLALGDAWRLEAWKHGRVWPFAALLDAGHPDAPALVRGLLPEVLAATPLACDACANAVTGEWLDLPAWLDAMDGLGVDTRTRAVGDALLRWLCTVTVYLAYQACDRETLEAVARRLDDRAADGTPVAPDWGWRWLECGGPSRVYEIDSSLRFMEALWQVLGPRLDWQACDVSGRTRFLRLLATPPVLGQPVDDPSGDGGFYWRWAGVWTLARAGVDLPWLVADANGLLPSDMPHRRLQWNLLAFLATSGAWDGSAAQPRPVVAGLLRAGLLRNHATTRRGPEYPAMRETLPASHAPPSHAPPSLAPLSLAPPSPSTASSDSLHASIMLEDPATRLADALRDLRKVWGFDPPSLTTWLRKDLPERRLANIQAIDAGRVGGAWSPSRAETLAAEEAACPSVSIWKDTASARRHDDAATSSIAPDPAPGPSLEASPATTITRHALYTLAGVDAMDSKAAGVSGGDGYGKALRERLRARLGADDAAWLPLAGVASTEAGLTALARDFPHFGKVCDFISDFLVLARAGDGVFWLPPTLLCGPPGIGKTFFLSTLAALVRTDFHAIDMAGVSGGIVLSGSSSQWRGGQPGMVFDRMVEGHHANPIVLLDELDKTADAGTSAVTPALLGLLEPSTAWRFTDECTGLPLDLRRVVWMASANERLAIPAPLLSRLQTFELPLPTLSERMVLFRAVWRALRSTHAWGQRLAPELADDAAQAAATAGEQARDGRSLLIAAAANALRAGRTTLAVADIRRAAQRAQRKPGIGFLSAGP